MMNRSSVLVLILYIFGLNVSCVKQYTVTELLSWLNDESNGLVFNKRVGDLVVRINYMPQSYINLRNYTDNSSEEGHRVHSFLVTLSPIIEGRDIMLRGIGSVEEYRQRILEMNFELASCFELKFSKQKMAPVLAILENSHDLSNARRFWVQFIDEAVDSSLADDEAITLTFTDNIFWTGIHDFRFMIDDINNIPSLKELEN
ncbi:MAG: hypothetical protein MI974_08820 [Chitinophagales bacterium]|nr:hypothetical protein [Chitinophagales bacterium]